MSDLFACALGALRWAKAHEIVLVPVPAAPEGQPGQLIVQDTAQGHYLALRPRAAYLYVVDDLREERTYEQLQFPGLAFVERVTMSGGTPGRSYTAFRYEVSK